MKQLTTLLFVFAIVGVQIVYGQNKKPGWTTKIPHQVCYASGITEKSFIPPPAEILLKSDGEKKSEIIVNYSLFPQNAKDAFEYAVGIWEHIVESDIPIYIQANWRTQGTNTLGSAGPSDFKTNFDFIPHEGRYYPIVLAEKISRKNLNEPGSPDIEATFNKSVNWYFGTDGDTPSEMYDFVTVVMHEIGHGLGFTGFYYVTSDGLGTSYYDNRGDATGFDILVSNFSNQFITDTSVFKNPSKELKSVLEAGVLFANSPVAIQRNNGIKPKLFAPSTFDNGSSIYHLNDLNYSAGTENSLMTHQLSKGEAIHDPGPLAKGILDDIGWSNVYIKFEKLKDIETTRPIAVNAAIKSDYLLDSASVFAYYSFDKFKNHLDSIPLVYTKSASAFTGMLTPLDTSTFVQYYISAGDTTGRNFSLPTGAPKSYYTITIAPDNKKPVLQHKPIPYFVLNEDFLKVQANVSDNVGIDTVFVEYSINGIEQTSFGLQPDSLTSYSAAFTFNTNTLKDNDVIEYKIIARDSSKAKNTTVFPENSTIKFNIEEIFAPVESYYNNFNTASPDFLINDFKIYQETGFQNAALHSYHPYPSPNNNDLHFDFTTFLKRPIIISEGGTMSFDEIVLVEPGEPFIFYPSQDFYDYVIVEGSSDWGKTWKALAPGYDSTDKEKWETVYNENINADNLSTNVGSPDLFINRQIDLLENGNFKAGDTILIQFRLYSDPYAKGWGWAIDNLRIQQPVSTDLLASENNISVYPNPFNNKVTLAFESNTLIDGIQIEIYSLTGQKVFNQRLNQTGNTIKKELDLSVLERGVYILSVHENGEAILNKKLIKRD